MTAHSLAVDLRLVVGVDTVGGGGTGLAVLVPVTVGVAGHADLIPGPTVPTVEPVMWWRVSETYPDPVVDRLDRPDPDVFAPTGRVEVPVGRPSVRISGTDMTFWRDVPCVLRSWSESEPWGWQTAVIEWPQATLLTDDDATVIAPGASVDIGLVDVDGTHVGWLWRGLVAEVEREESSVTATCIGMLRQAAHAQHQPPFFPSLADMGTAVADAMDGVVSRRYGPTSRVSTGIGTTRRGARSDTVHSFVSGLLSLMTTDDGTGQWTLMPTDDGVPVIRLKDRTSEHWTVTAGQRGVSVTLTHDLLEDPAAIFGSGTGADGGRWDNARWPGSVTDAQPDYPNNNPSNTIRRYERDADTDNGRGVSQIQARLRELGHSCPLDGYYADSTYRAVRAFQASAGIQVDGVVGGQTWNALWPILGVLGDPYFAPLAVLPWAEPHTYTADGAITGSNGEYDPSRVRVERFVAFGEGVDRDRAIGWAVAQLARNATIPNVLGTVTLASDPQQGLRRAIRAGQNIRVRGYGGVPSGLLLHISAVEHTETRTRLTVDARARDALELAAIVDRDREAVDPARQILTARQSTTDQDLTPWNAEAPAGHVPLIALWGGLWSVVAVPMGAWGKVVRTVMGTSPAAAYAAIVFSRQVTAAWLLSVVGNPLADTGNGFGAIANAEPTLNAAGMLVAWGMSGQAMGYFPGQTSSSGGTGTLTGRFDERSAWDWASEDRGYVWLALYADRPTKLDGRMFVNLPGGGG